MIKIRLYSPFTEVPPYERTLLFENFFIGPARKCDVVLPKSSHSKTLLKAKATKDGLLIQSQASEFFYVDGKKLSGSCLLRKGQKVSLGESSFELIDFDYAQINRVHNINELYEKFYVDKKEYLSILESIEKEIIYSDDQLISPKN